MGRYSNHAALKGYNNQVQQFSPRGKNFKPGNYIVQIVRCELRIAGAKGDTFLVQTVVKAAQSEDPLAPKAGERATHAWKASGDPMKVKMAANDWLNFLCAAFDCKQADLSDAQWDQLHEDVLDNGKLEGQIFALHVFLGTLKDDSPFTYHEWRGIPNEEQLASFGLSPSGERLS